MKQLSSAQLSEILRHWQAPAPGPGLETGVWARVDARQQPALDWLRSAWTFRAAAVLTALLWVLALRMPATAPAASATNSLTAALALAGGTK